MSRANKFSYTAKNDQGKLLEGSVIAESLKSAVEKLSAMGYYPVTIDAAPDASAGGMRQSKINLSELILFTRQIADLLGSGATLTDALAIIARQPRSARLKVIVDTISGDIKEGKSLSEALGRYPQVFSDFYVGLVSSGETCGMLQEVLVNISETLEKEQELRTRIISSLAYPVIAASTGFLTLIFLFTFVIPRLVRVFAEMNQVLPLPTRIMIGISQLIVHNGALIAALGGCMGFLVFHLKDNRALAVRADAFKLRFPFWGDIIRKIEIARLCRTLGMCVKSGVPALTALKVAESTVSNAVFKAEVGRIHRGVKEGKAISACLQDSKLFPVELSSMVQIAEESNTLDKVFLKIEANYLRDLETAMKIAMTLIEPVTIILLGVIVGLIVISILLPVFRMNFAVY